MAVRIDGVGSVSISSGLAGVMRDVETWDSGVGISLKL